MRATRGPVPAPLCSLPPAGHADRADGAVDDPHAEYRWSRGRRFRVDAERVERTSAAALPECRRPGSARVPISTRVSFSNGGIARGVRVSAGTRSVHGREALGVRATGQATPWESAGNHRRHIGPRRGPRETRTLEALAAGPRGSERDVGGLASAPLRRRLMTTNPTRCTGARSSVRTLVRVVAIEAMHRLDASMRCIEALRSASSATRSMDGNAPRRPATRRRAARCRTQHERGGERPSATIRRRSRRRRRSGCATGRLPRASRRPRRPRWWLLLPARSRLPPR